MFGFLTFGLQRLEAQLVETKAASEEDTFQIATASLSDWTVLAVGDNKKGLEEIVVVAREQLKLGWRAPAS